MQLKIRRSQRQGGVFGGTAIFCLDARVLFTRAELDSVTRYKLQSECIYNSEAARRHLAAIDENPEGSMGEAMKGLGHAIAARMHLNVTIASLQNGQRIECKSLEELLGAEDAMMTACRNLKGYLDTAATFDGREVLFDFDADGPTVVASSASPQLALASSSPVSPAAIPSPTPAPPPPMPAAVHPAQPATASGPAVAATARAGEINIFYYCVAFLAFAMVDLVLLTSGHTTVGILIAIVVACGAMMWFAFRSK